MFRDRLDAGRQLASKLEGYASEKCIVYALPRGGVPVGFEVSTTLRKPLEVIIVKKIGAPNQEELAVGAVTEGTPPTFYYNESLMRYLGISEQDVSEITQRKLKEIRDIRQMYRGSEEILIDPHSVAIIVDDGIATGATMKAAIDFLKKIGQSRIVVAIPVGEQSVIEKIEEIVDEVVCVNSVETMYAVGQFYSDFSEVKHDTVLQLLKRAKSLVRPN